MRAWVRELTNRFIRDMTYSFMTVPNELLEELGWKLGDEVQIKIEEGKLIYFLDNNPE